LAGEGDGNGDDGADAHYHGVLVDLGNVRCDPG
jgi:hypothetical protein